MKSVACLITAIALATVAAALPALGQQEPSAGQEGARRGTAQPAAAQQAQFVPAPELFDLQFKGGNAGQYIEAIRQAAPHANIVVFGDLMPIDLPAVQLKNVDLSTALQVLHGMSEAGMIVNIVQHAPKVTTAANVGQLPVFTVHSKTRSAAGVAPVPAIILEISELIEGGLTPADVLTAIETAINLDARSPAQLKFHEQTALLIVRGQKDQVELANAVTHQLREQVQRKRNQREHVEQLERRLKEATERLDAAVNRQHKLQAENTRLKEMLETTAKQVPGESPFERP